MDDHGAQPHAARTIRDTWTSALAHEAAGEWSLAAQAHAAIVARDRTQIAVWLRLSMLEQRRGRYRSARQHLLDAAEAAMATGTTRHIGFLGQQLLAFDEHGLVARLIGTVPRDGREWLAQSAVLAQQLSLVDQDSLALELLDVAAPRAAPSPLLARARAVSLRNCGRFDESGDALELALRLAPLDAQAHWMLANLRRSIPLGARVARVRAALDAAGTDGLDRAYLQYALFKELDDASDTDAAWTALQAGAACARACVRHDPARERVAVDALRSLFDGRGPAADRSGPQGPRTPIFVVGMPRTGTTVLERVLDNHPMIRSAGELHDFRAALCMVSDRFVGHPLDPATVEVVGRVNLASVGDTYLERTGSVAGGREFLVDKNPTNVYHAGAIARALPGARILCLVRDPMDACFSNLKELFAGGAHAYSYRFEELASHHARFREMVAHWQTVIADQFMVVEYESLAADPHGVGARVMEFVGVPFDATSIDITANPRPSSTASSVQVRQPIHSRSVGAWRRYATQLAPLQVLLERARMGEAL